MNTPIGDVARQREAVSAQADQVPRDEVVGTSGDQDLGTAEEPLPSFPAITFPAPAAVPPMVLLAVSLI